MRINYTFFVLLSLPLLIISYSGCVTIPAKAKAKIQVQAGLPSSSRPKLKKEIWKVEYIIPSYASALKGQKICLDPGHGGDAEVPGGYKRGPTGLREAEVNLRVAKYLKEFLEKAGAIVYMTREDDSFVSLEDRSYFANTCGAEYFISLHHNAHSIDTYNFTSTWYHADPDYSHINLDLCRYIQDGVANALNLAQFTPRPLRSDYEIYPNSGFAVLRNTKIPAALCEASFHSNPEEEKKLANPEYNRLEAYGYFIGLAKYFYAHVPKVQILAPPLRTDDRQPQIVAKIDDGKGGKEILVNSIFVMIDSTRIPHQYDAVSAVISAKPDYLLSNNYHNLHIGFMNVNKNSVYPCNYVFQVAPPIASLEMQVQPETIPADGISLSAIEVKVFDKEGNPVADGELIELTASAGEILFSPISTINGMALGYLRSATEATTVTITARIGDVYAVSAVSFDTSTEFGLVMGKVFGRKKRAIANAKVEVPSLVEHPIVYTYRDGVYILPRLPAGKQVIMVSAEGYRPIKIPVNVKGAGTTLLNVTLIRK